MSHGLHRSLVLLIVGACLVLGMAACKSSPTTEPVVSSPPAFESPSSKAENVDESTGFKNAEPGSESLGDSGSSAEKASYQLKRINFDFDRYEVRQDAIRILGDDAATIKQYPQYRVRIEGHCDERGTVEYNLALGEKRARAARDYLVSLGRRRRDCGSSRTARSGRSIRATTRTPGPPTGAPSSFSWRSEPEVAR